MIIFHIDMDAFFASIEEAENPALRGKAVIIGGMPNTRGVVSTCSYPARRFGVHSAMSLNEAYKRCPHGIFLPGNHGLYREYSHKIVEIFLACTPYVEVVSIDEAYLDVTRVANLYGGPIALAELLKKIIWQQTQLTCSIGIGASKLITKIAASSCKPNGLLMVSSGQEPGFLAPLSIETIPGIGKKTAARMHADGFKTISQLQSAGPDLLMNLYGSWGYYCHQAAFGYDKRQVQWEETAPKSIGAEETFERDQHEEAVLKEALEKLCEKVWKRLRRHKMRTRGISLKLRNQKFHTITRSCTFSTHTNDLCKITAAAFFLFNQYHAEMIPLRLLGISLEKLTDGYWQPTFWE